MGTYAHIIQPLKGSYLPKRIISLSIVSKELTNDASRNITSYDFAYCFATCFSVRNGNVLSRTEYFTNNSEDLKRWILSLLRVRKETWLFATELYSSITLAGFWTEVDRGRLNIKTWIKEDPPTIFVFTKGKASLICVDLANYWNCSDKQLLIASNLPSPRQPVNGATDHEYAEYARLKCMAIENNIREWLALCHDQNIRHWACGSGNTSYSHWRSINTGEKVHVHSDKCTNRLERRGYYGGRADCHIIGQINSEIIHVDVNSLYPWIASVTPLPIEHISTGPYNMSQVIRRLDAGDGVIASCMIVSNTHDYPCRYKGKTYFARGVFHTILAGPELAVGIQRGHVKTVGFAAIYHLGFPFGTLLADWYSLRHDYRRAGRVANEHFVKGLLCSLVGKFASKDYQWEVAPTERPAIRWGSYWKFECNPDRKTHYRVLGGRVERQLVPSEGRDSVVALTAYVNSAGRVYMEALKEITGVENIYYEDTDSLHINRDGFQRLDAASCLSGDEFGRLKTVQIALSGCYRGIRNYTLDEREVRSGLTDNATQICDNVWLDIRKAPNGVMFEYGPPTQVTTQNVKISKRYDAYNGRVNANGRVKPLILCL